jgi:hypothetical protein
MSEPTEFETVLSMYKSNLTEYKASGNAAYKTAADTTKAWLDNYIEQLGSNVAQTKEEIQQFVQTYEDDDKELASLKSDMSMIREKGPQLQTMYETEHNAEGPPTQVDYSQYYIKGAVLAGVIALVAVGSFF